MRLRLNRKPSGALPAALTAILFFLPLSLPAENGTPDNKNPTAISVHSSLKSALKKLDITNIQKTAEAAPTDLRGYGLVSAAGATWGEKQARQSLVVFETQDASHAAILASKYLSDLLGFSTAKLLKNPSKTGGAILEIPDAGAWKLGIEGANVFVLTAFDQESLAIASKKLNAESWTTPETAAFPKYLDCFDGSGLGMWWMPPTKPEEILAFAKEDPAIVNVHSHHGLKSSYAPNVYDSTAADNIIAQARLVGKPYRFMIWGGIPAWWSRSVGDLKPHVESAMDSAHPSRDLPGADGYTNTQISSKTAQGLEMNAMLEVMNRYKDNEDLIAWMEPHGEFFLSDPRFVPPNAKGRFADYLQTVKGYQHIKDVNEAFGTDAKNWESFPYPEMSYFFGRRGNFVDLDENSWRWWPGFEREEGVAKGFQEPNFDDSGWAKDKRTSRRLLNQFRAKGNTAPLWYRFTEKVPSDFLTGGEKIYLHVMPYTLKEGRTLAVWVNGTEVPGVNTDPENFKNSHTQFDVTGMLKPGTNSFAIYSHGGRISYRVFLSKSPGKSYPFSDRRLNQFWMDWNDYLIWEKLETLKTYLSAMRSIDPVRPIKVMTPHMFQSSAMDLFEKFGAYPQLTGEGPWYRPMHYKGYSRLRGLPGSSEGGSAAPTSKHVRQKFANILWANQDAHDYVFDIQRDFWSRPDVLEWWKQNRGLLRTVGKMDFAEAKLGVLRDVEQEERFLNSEIWNWDVSRGPLPSAGISPVLVDGPDFDKGLADKLPIIFDCSTSVMTDQRIKSIQRYIRNGGIFVAQFNTGRHSPLAFDTWPLAAAFGLKVTDNRNNEQDMNQWPTAKITFTDDQNLLPKLRGKTLEGSGLSIDSTGAEKSGSITIEGNSPEVKAVAKWESGGMAVCDVSYGKGRLVWLGTPFHVRFKDQEGKWINAADRQGLFEDLLAGLGVAKESESTDPRVWVERRESKNGLYDVFMAAAMNLPTKTWEETDSISTNLTLRPAHGSMVFDLAQENPESIPATRVENGGLKITDQLFTPYQVREYAVVRENPGLNGPLHWLAIQWNQWRALEKPDGSILEDVAEIQATQAELLGQDGIDLNKDWKVRLFSGKPPETDDWINPAFNRSSWKTGQLGTWLARGWEDTTAAQYLKTVSIPSKWIAGDRRVFLGFKAGFHAMGIVGSGQLWVNGKSISTPLKNPMLLDITEAAATGKLDLAMEVRGTPMSGGPGGVLYLWSLPKPLKTLDLGGQWTKAKSWHETDGPLSVPGPTEKAFGLRRSFELPPDWKGKNVRLVVEQDEKGRSVEGVILNQTGYFREAPDSLSNYGIRVDQWLKDGQNEIDLYCPGHGSYQEYYKKGIRSMAGEIESVRLELYD